MIQDLMENVPKDKKEEPDALKYRVKMIADVYLYRFRFFLFRGRAKLIRDVCELTLSTRPMYRVSRASNNEYRGEVRFWSKKWQRISLSKPVAAWARGEWRPLS